MSVFETVFLALVWAWVFSAVLFLRNTVLPRMPITLQPDALGLPAETVHFRATDGVLLEGWKIPGQPQRPWLILCHGLGTNRADLLDIGEGLYRLGYNLFLFDFRAHGGSAGRTTSFGWRERRDLQGALAFLGQQPDVPPAPYGIYGISMGGAVALTVAADDERLGAIAVDSPYVNLEESIVHHIKLLYPWLPRAPFVWFVLWTYRLRFGVSPRAMSPEEAAGRLGTRPLLVIQGAGDPRMPLEGAQQILRRASGPKEILVIPGGGHLQGYALDTAGYLRQLDGFFEKAL